MIKHVFSAALDNLVNLKVLYLHRNEIIFFQPNVFTSRLHLHSFSLRYNKLAQYFPLKILDLHNISAVNLYVDNSSVCCELKKVTHCYNSSGIEEITQCPDDKRYVKTTIWKVAIAVIGMIISVSHIASVVKKIIKRIMDETDKINVTFILMTVSSVLHGIYLVRIAVSSDQAFILKESKLQASIQCQATAYAVLLAQALKYLTSMQYLVKITMVIYPQYKVSPKKLTQIAEYTLIVGCVILIVVCGVLICNLDNVIIYSEHLCHSFIFVSPVKYVVVVMLSIVLTVILMCAIGIARLVIATKTAAGRIVYTNMEKVLFVKTSMTVVVIFLDWAYCLCLLILSLSQTITILFYIILITIIFSINPLLQGIMNILS